MKQLDRLLFVQGQRCFFCKQAIPEGEASVEHLVASANGGGNTDDNCVACCVTINAAMGSLSIKEKLHIVLNQRGSFSCPKARPAPRHADAKADLPEVDRIAVIVADLKKRGASRPRKIATLSNTIAAAFQKKLTAEENAALLATLVSKGYVALDDEKVTYSLPK